MLIRISLCFKLCYVLLSGKENTLNDVLGIKGVLEIKGLTFRQNRTKLTDKQREQLRIRFKRNRKKN